VTLPSTQLLIFGFGLDGNFESQLVGALERIESGGATAHPDALFVGRDGETWSRSTAKELQMGAVGVDVAAAPRPAGPSRYVTA
jgi:hypothetical protein